MNDTDKQAKVFLPALADILAKARHFGDGFDVSQAKHSGAAGTIAPIVQDKPWGFELWLAFTDKYALKVLHVHQGKRLSLQRHRQKEESWLVLLGEPELIIGGETVAAHPGQMLHIPTGTIHRITAPRGDIEILEVSTPELWDVERLQDDSGRK